MTCKKCSMKGHNRLTCMPCPYFFSVTCIGHEHYYNTFSSDAVINNISLLSVAVDKVKVIMILIIILISHAVTRTRAMQDVL